MTVNVCLSFVLGIWILVLVLCKFVPLSEYTYLVSHVLLSAYRVKTQFLHPCRGLRFWGLAAQTVNGAIKVRAPGLTSSSSFPSWGYDPVGSMLFVVVVLFFFTGFLFKFC